MALIFPGILARLQQLFPAEPPIYLVGGAVRDALLQREVKDLDFALSGDVLGIARRVANAIQGAYYPLDESRDTGRVILPLPEGGRLVLDFAALRGPDLETDLRLRDFTLNAMALSLHDLDRLVDPLGGLEDLRRGVLRACSESAMQDDQLRVLRGIRLANANRWLIQSETRALMRRALPGLAGVSPERVRDELFHILEGPRPATALETLQILGGLPYVLPELVELKGVEQPAPHVRDVWGHTLDVLKGLEALHGALGQQFDPEAPTSFYMGLVSVRLGRYRQQLHDHFSHLLNPNRSLHALLYLAALYHDSGKPATRREATDGRVRFLEHEILGTELATHRVQALHLSNDEIDRLSTVVRHHMRPLLLAQMEGLPSRRAIYRFFRDTGPAGVEVCLHALADTLATYGPSLTQDIWMRQLDIVRSLLEAWWERPEESVAPPALLDGHAIMQAFNLHPGPQIGRLLEVLREAQATGQVIDRQQALEFTAQQIEAVAAAPDPDPSLLAQDDT
jgi:tRNA nucleotidyltransferase/poly(A) polymerase